MNEKEFSRNKGLRIPRAYVNVGGGYTVQLQYRYNPKIKRKNEFNYGSLGILYSQNPDELELYEDLTIVNPNTIGGAVYEKLVPVSSIVRNKQDGTVTRTMRFCGSGSDSLVPGETYYWRLVSRINGKNYSHLLEGGDGKGKLKLKYAYNSVLANTQETTMGGGVESSAVTLGSGLELEEYGAGSLTFAFDINNPDSEELVSVRVESTSGAYTAFANAEKCEDGRYRATVYPGKKTISAKAVVKARYGTSAGNVKENVKESDALSAAARKLDSSEISYKLLVVKENDEYYVYPRMELMSVTPDDADSLSLAVRDTAYKTEYDEDGNVEYDGTESFDFEIVESDESPSGYKAVLEDTGGLEIGTKTSASISLILYTTSDLSKITTSSDGDEEETADSDTKLWTKTVKCSAGTPIESISFTDTELTIPLGTAVTITPEIAPSNATDKSLEWTSSDADVAVVSDKGVVSARAEGKTVISVRALDGSDVESSNELTINVFDDSVAEEPEEEEGVAEEDADDKNLSEDNVWVTSVDDSEFFYSGKAFKPVVRVYDGNSLLTEKTDYTISYKNNVNVYEITSGESGFDATKAPQVVVKLKGNYSGSRIVFFRIFAADETPQSLKKAEISLEGGNSVTYDGDIVKPVPVVMLGNITLEAGKDFTVSYKNNTKAGKATLTVNGIGKYYDSKSLNFVINGRSMDSDSISVTMANGSERIYAVYSAGGAKPAIKVTYGENVLKEGVDYSVKYSNNKAVTTGSTKKPPTLVLSGMGYYKGRLPVSYEILQKDFSTVNVSAADVIENAKANKYQTKLTVKDKDGTTLKAGKDYEKKLFYYSYDTENDMRGNALGKYDRPVAGAVIRVELVGKGNYSDSRAVAYYRVLEKGNDISKAKVKIADQYFVSKGSAVTISDAKAFTQFSLAGVTLSLVENENEDGFMIVDGSYINNTKTGVARLTVRGSGKYGGTKQLSFKIKARDVK